MTTTTDTPNAKLAYKDTPNAKPNAKLAYKVLDYIDAHPTEWDQQRWRTCFAGLTVKLAGGVSFYGPTKLAGGVTSGEWVADGPPELLNLHIEIAAAKVLGIDPWEVNDFDPDENEDEFLLFLACNDRADLERIVAKIFGPRPDAASPNGTGCRCECLGTSTPEHAPGGICLP